MELWYPKAKKPSYQMNTKGEYANGFPQGAIVHFTAGRHGGDPLEYGKQQGYAYFGITEKGEVWQAAPLNRWGHHAGASTWPGLGSGVSDKLVGIEVQCAGRVTKVGEKYKAWFHKKESEYFSADEVRYVKKKDNVQEGYYHKYTPAQEKALTELLQWMHAQAPSVFKYDYVLGHDEVAPSRKDDPGGALSMTMPEYRKLLKGETAPQVCPTCKRAV